MMEAIGTTNVTNAIPFNQQLKEIKACYIQENWKKEATVLKTHLYI